MPRSQLSNEASLRLRRKYHLKILAFWTAKFSPCFCRFHISFIIHLCSYFPTKANSTKLLRVHQGTVQYFKKNNKWALFAPVRRNLLAEGLRLVYIPDEDIVFLCGGLRLQARSAYYITRTKTKQLSDMSTRRSLHGLCYAKSINSVLVFGGEQLRERFEQVKSAEKFDLRDNEWKSLPDMLETRADFQPCVATAKVFLCGGNQSKTCELFDLKTGEYSILSIGMIDPGPCFSVYLPEDTILVVTSYRTLHYSLSTLRAFPSRDHYTCLTQPCPPPYKLRFHAAIAYSPSSTVVQVIGSYQRSTIDFA
jgi:hypothetical protein